MSVTAGSRSRGVGMVWFRHCDLRLDDHAALHRAHTTHDRVIHVFCFDERNYKGTIDFSRSLPRVGWRKMGLFKTEFLLSSVKDLRENIAIASLSGPESTSIDQKLFVRMGIPEVIIPQLAKQYDVSTIYCTEAEATEERDVQNAIATEIGSSALLVPLWDNTLYHIDDLPFLVPLPDTRDIPLDGNVKQFGNFPPTATQFRTQCEGNSCIRNPLAGPLHPTPIGSRLLFKPCPEKVSQTTGNDGGDVEEGEMPSLHDLMGMGPHQDHWTGIETHSEVRYHGGENEALRRLHYYLWEKDLLKTYFRTRNGMLGEDYSTKLSPWLATGCLSPRRIAAEVRAYEQTRVKNKDTYWLIFELTFRDYFKYYARAHGSSVFKKYGPKGKSQKVWGPVTDEDLRKLEMWRLGCTGNPMVDANMRELLNTGYMSNRGRQIVASYLTRDMCVDWRLGAMHFESLLIDHDVCLNWGNWTYAAGVGSDPREDRYFNVLKQTKNYDPEYRYIHRWVPESQSWADEKMKAMLKFGTTAPSFARYDSRTPSRTNTGGPGSNTPRKRKVKSKKYINKGRVLDTSH
mmetsp:Transcript_25528/g.37691  ORF Transcript_25528/g.37691 Transcript_25528/m.37691 type:complete len:571 (+) Transcript_25528:75-1787(+)